MRGIESWWLIILATISLIVMYKDVKNRTISNLECILVLIVVFPFFLLYGESISLLYVLSIVVIGVVLNQLSILGAGDTKLLAAYSFAIRPDYLWPILFLIVCIGGLLSMVYYVYGRLTNIEKTKQRGVPYGIPICIGSYLGVLASL
ncbi:prepilin peptidase [Vibrio splendidus]